MITEGLIVKAVNGQQVTVIDRGRWWIFTVDQLGERLIQFLQHLLELIIDNTA